MAIPYLTNMSRNNRKEVTTMEVNSGSVRLIPWYILECEILLPPTLNYGHTLNKSELVTKPKRLKTETREQTLL